MYSIYQFKKYIYIYYKRSLIRIERMPKIVFDEVSLKHILYFILVNLQYNFIYFKSENGSNWSTL